MGLQFINRPVAVDRSAYEEAISTVTETLASADGIKTVFRFGNITTPGISDIDILAVFNNGAVCSKSGFEDLKPSHTQLFTHGIMALSEDHFYKNFHYTIWSHYIYTSGENIGAHLNDSKTHEQTEQLKIQTALEFIIANYIDLKLQLTYGIFKLRSLLQHMKGLIYDLEFLGITTGKLYDMLLQLRNWSLKWFTDAPDDNKLENWIVSFTGEFERFCSDLFTNYAVYLPMKDKYIIAKNVTLVPSAVPGYSHRGVVLPNMFSSIGKKYINLQNRMNRFEFRFPVVHTAPPIITERFEFLQEMKRYNRIHLPGFMTITTSILSKIL